jgi:hypothetical protein
VFAQGIVFVGAVTVGALAWRKWDHIFRGHGLESPVNVAVTKEIVRGNMAITNP